MIKDVVKNLSLSSTLRINEISKELESKGKEILKYLNDNIDLIKLLCRLMDDKLGNKIGTSEKLIIFIKDMI